MKLSQNSLFKAAAYARPVAESGILGLVQVKEVLLNGLILVLGYLQRKLLLPRPLVNPQGLFYPTGEGSGSNNEESKTVGL